MAFNSKALHSGTSASRKRVVRHFAWYAPAEVAHAAPHGCPDAPTRDASTLRHLSPDAPDARRPDTRHPETSGCCDLPRSKAAISACRVRFAAWPQPAAQQYRLDVADVAAPADPGRGSERRFERARFYKQ
jgi:hypothetical protein